MHLTIKVLALLVDGIKYVYCAAEGTFQPFCAVSVPFWYCSPPKGK